LSTQGGYQKAGVRGIDSYSHNGIVVTYSAGEDSIKVLKAGGAEYYSWGGISNNSYSIEIDAGNNVKVFPKNPMRSKRVFANSVVLPNGKVMVIGGRTKLPSADVGATGDDASEYKPEVWDPSNDTWEYMAPMKIPRNYHSVALLLQDGRIWAAGGGFCSDDGNATECLKITHPNGEFYSPSYLFDPKNGDLAVRPKILQAPKELIKYGTEFEVVTDSATARFNLVRLSSVTHCVNTDQRFIELARNPRPVKGFSYKLTAPSDRAAVPGLYFLFAFNQQGVPSIASTIQIGK
jgi:galactose oxidase